MAVYLSKTVNITLIQQAYIVIFKFLKFKISNVGNIADVLLNNHLIKVLPSVNFTAYGKAILY